VGQPDLPVRRPVLAGDPHDLAELLGAQAADRDAEPDRRVLAVGLPGDPDVVVTPEVRGGAGPALELVAASTLELCAELVRADPVEEELEPGLAPLGPVLVRVAEDRGDLLDDVGRLRLGDEDVDPAGEARVGGEPAADAHVEPGRPSSARAPESATSLISPRAQSSAQPVTEILYLRGRFE
jgi:hypothetical protein